MLLSGTGGKNSLGRGMIVTAGATGGVGGGQGDQGRSGRSVCVRKFLRVRQENLQQLPTTADNNEIFGRDGSHTTTSEHLTTDRRLAAELVVNTGSLCPWLLPPRFSFASTVVTIP